MVQIQTRDAEGKIHTQRVPLVSYYDERTGQTYITLHANQLQVPSL